MDSFVYCKACSAQSNINDTIKNRDGEWCCPVCKSADIIHTDRIDIGNPSERPRDSKKIETIQIVGSVYSVDDFADRVSKVLEDPDLDMVNHPKHYTSHPSGIECIQITRHMGFNTGNAIKYLWRADEKGAAIQDLEKAIWYIQDEIQKRGNTI